MVVVSTFAAILYAQFSAISKIWPILMWAVTIPLIGFGWLNYRCPFCGNFPEDDDMPLFNPINCCTCGAKLRQ